MHNQNVVRQQIGQLFHSPGFMLEVAGEGKSEPVTDLAKAALSMPTLYAVVEAAELLQAIYPNSCIVEHLKKIATGQPSIHLTIAEKCARLAWQSQQPLLGIDRIARPIMGCTSGNMPDGELEKDTARVIARARLLLQRLGISALRGVNRHD